MIAMLQRNAADPQPIEREIEADLALLQSTTRHAPAGPSDEEIEAILETQRKVRNRTGA